MYTFKIGDPVVLITGSIPMVIRLIEGGTAHCIWMHSGIQRHGSFPLISLVLMLSPSVERGLSKEWTL
jgi:hypothetical protein